MKKNTDIKDNLKITDDMFSQCENGDIKIGKTLYKGEERDVYCNYKKEDYCAGRVVVGGIGEGKSTLLQNFIKDSLESSQGAVIIDTSFNNTFTNFIKDSDELSSKVRVIDFTNPDTVPAFEFNTCSYLDDNENDIDKKIALAYEKAHILTEFMRNKGFNEESLTVSAQKCLWETALLVFLSTPNAVLQEVIEALSKNKEELISKIPKNILDELANESFLTDELENKRRKSHISKEEIQLKYELFTHNFYLKKILSKKKSITDIDLADTINQEKTLIIKIPENIFDASTTSALINYYLTNILKIKANNNSIKTNLFIDDIYKLPYSYSLINEVLCRSRIMNLSMFISVQSLNQLNNGLKEHLSMLGSTFIVLRNGNLKSFKELSSIINIPNLEGIDIEKYGALCLAINKYGKYELFEVKLAEPPKVNNMYII